MTSFAKMNVLSRKIISVATFTAVIVVVVGLGVQEMQAGYTAEVSNLSPIRYFKFDGDDTGVSGSTMFDTAGNDTATYTNTTTLITGPNIGEANKAATVPGGQVGKGTVTAGLPFANQDRSVMFWYRRSSTYTHDGSYVSWGRDKMFSVYGGATNSALRSGAVGQNEPVSSDPLADDVWRFAVVTASAGNAWEMYIAEVGDAVVANVSSGVGSVAGFGNPSGVSIGLGEQTCCGTFTFPNADIDEVAVFSTVLTEAQINGVLSSIPEPSSLILLGIGTLLLTLRRRRR